ncbi:amidase family protein [Klenkia taihuensis]|uniref:amidase family protein n=1 Tax=Klenkia taihuensis TaxID=1225127 RepID=UPI000B859C18|nr:amidase family protein [Klenkia taihuensis]
MRSPRTPVLLAVVAALLAGCSSGSDPAPAAAGAAGPGPDLRDLDALTIPDLQSMMDDGDLTAVQLTQAYLDRVAEHDDEVGAVLTLNPDALADAQASDDARADGGARSPLEGIPVLLKDNVDTADLPTTAGSRLLLDSEPDDATITARLLDAGAVVIGKANLSEWANFRGADSTSGWSGAGGQTANPYVLDRNPCGSSSGSAAGVAASFAQVAIGTETDGSIVCPSGANGVVGLKPTIGQVSRDGIVPISAEQDTAGPIARHAVDAALLMAVVAGPDEADDATGEVPDGTDTGFADLDLDALQGARVGVWSPAADSGVDADTLAVLTSAVAALEAAGATTVPVELPYQDEIGAGETPALLAEFDRDLTAYLGATDGDVPDDLAGLVAENADDPVELAYFGQELFTEAIAAPDAEQTREGIRDLAQRSVDETLAQGPGDEDDLTAIVALTGTPAWVTRYAALDGVADDFVYSSSTPAAVAGYPSVSVPAGFAGPRGALPVGVSFIGTGWSDADLLDVAADFEDQAQARRAPGFLATVGA